MTDKPEGAPRAADGGSLSEQYPRLYAVLGAAGVSELTRLIAEMRNKKAVQLGGQTVYVDDER